MPLGLWAVSFLGGNIEVKVIVLKTGEYLHLRFKCRWELTLETQLKENGCPFLKFLKTGLE